MTIYRNDYTPSPWKQKHITLRFGIPPDTDGNVIVTSWIDYEAREDNLSTIELHGEILNDEGLIHLELKTPNDEYIDLPYKGKNEKNKAKIFGLPQNYQKGETIQIFCVTNLRPLDNKTLMGLYVSNGRYYTQCEPEGFRHITYCIDRPDELATIDTFIKIPNCSILKKESSNKKTLTLCNGTLKQSTRNDPDYKKNFDFWSDTIPKPTYLFALVIAKDLESITDTFTTMSGKNVKLGLYAEKKDVKRLHHAMNALKDAMKWDEKIYGREVDTKEYNIVAVDDFNMGAMENKNLNIFNTAFVLADQDIATDIDFLNVSSVVAHEYFHNWTGNRITCRDWFQLTLKEGLTVYRDQCFTDTITKTARLDDIKTLKAIQWAEDSGPMKHAIRPDAYETINNFYTSTIYEKGAEVIRMLRLIVGQEAYDKALTYYFETFDGQAVTCDDFLQSFIITAKTEQQQLLQQFGNWYSQVGNVCVHYEWSFNTDNSSSTEKNTISITLKQFSDGKPSQLVIPIAATALGYYQLKQKVDQFSEYRPFPLEFEYVEQQLPLLILNEEKQTFNIDINPSELMPPFASQFEIKTVELLTGFSAPVELIQSNVNGNTENTGSNLENYLDDKMHLSDDYLIYNNFQHYLKLFLSGQIEATYLRDYIQTFFSKKHRITFEHAGIMAQTLTMPSFDEFIEFMKQQSVKNQDNNGPQINPQAYLLKREELQEKLRKTMPWLAIHWNLADIPVKKDYYDYKDADLRRFRNMAMSYVVDLKLRQGLATLLLKEADNLTERLAALRLLMNYEGHRLFNEFYETWKDEALIIDKWFAIQAQSEEVLSIANNLLEHSAFKRENPNRCRSLLMNLFKNPVFFHQENGDGYRLWSTEVIKIDVFNPQLAARFARLMEQWRFFDVKTQALMKEQIVFVSQQDNLSTDVREVIEKILCNK